MDSDRKGLLEVVYELTAAAVTNYRKLDVLTHTYSLGVREGGSLMWVPGLVPPGGSKGDSISLTFPVSRGACNTWLMGPHHSDLCFSCHITFYLPLTLLPPSYKDPCDFLGAIWIFQDGLP